jgi:hypothetical protein
MQSDRSASANGHPVSPPNGSDPHIDLERLQAMCRHQAVVIDTLSEAASTFHRGATALKAENAELRAELGGMRRRRRSPADAAGRLADGESVEVVVALDTRAPGAARAFVVECVERRVVMGGFGLNLVQMLSERWGVERLAAGGKQVWAQLFRAPGAGAIDASAVRTA